MRTELLKASVRILYIAVVCDLLRCNPIKEGCDYGKYHIRNP